MSDLKSQRRLASRILKVGENRVWIDPSKLDEADTAITREEIRKFVHEGVIKALPAKGTSTGRARALHAKKRKGLRSGPGSHTGSPRARVSRKQTWIIKIRALRRRLLELKAKKVITAKAYGQIYRMASSGRFTSIGDMERYLKAHEIWRKR